MRPGGANDPAPPGEESDGGVGSIGNLQTDVSANPYVADIVNPVTPNIAEGSFDPIGPGDLSYMGG